MKLVKKTIILAQIIFLLGITPLISVSGQTLAGTIYSRPSDEPVIDGYLNDAEWNNGITQDFTLHHHLNSSDIIQIEVTSIYDDYNHLYIGLSIFDDNFVGMETFVIFFKVNDSGDFMQFHDPLTPYINNGNDAKGIFLGSNNTINCFTQLNVFDAWFDASVLGDNNCAAKCHNDSSGFVTLEYDILFHTFDVPEACDMNVVVGDKIEVILWYLDDTGYYSGYLYNSTEYEYGVIDIGGLPPVDIGISSTALILTVFSVNLIAILIIKKKKK